MKKKGVGYVSPWRSAKIGHVDLRWRGEVSHQVGITVKQNQGVDPLLRYRAHEVALIILYSSPA